MKIDSSNVYHTDLHILLSIMELHTIQIQSLLSRFPLFELSYEKVAHKKVSASYSLAMAIPRGKKYYLWYTFYGDRNVCFLMELNKERRISRVSIVDTWLHPSWSLGTILYGTLLENILGMTDPASVATASPQSVFVIEEIYAFQGRSLREYTFSEKFRFIYEVLETQSSATGRGVSTGADEASHTVVLSLPILWIFDESVSSTDSVPGHLAKTVGYPIHHIQYRDPYRIAPYLNVVLNKLGNASTSTNATTSTTTPTAGYEPPVARDHVFDYHKPQYKYATVFQVKADIQYDIYHLYAYDDATHAPVYVQVAGVPNYKCSVFLNGLFRRIRENENLDWIEESEDESDFENTAFDKHVDLAKTLTMECIFHPKCKKWVPTRVVGEQARMVSLSKLTRSTDTQGRAPQRPHSHPHPHPRKYTGKPNK
jgi:hypothetical protein